jgi:aldose 1-epimerase
VLEVREFGSLNSTPVSLFTLTRPDGCEARVITYGATLVGLSVPDNAGRLADIVLGFDDLAGYVGGKAYIGATVGRVANRIGHGSFQVDGHTFNVAKNDGPDHLHGGVVGWDKVVWTATSHSTATYDEVLLSYTSKDGEEGYPGTVQAEVRYQLHDGHLLTVEMTATTDELTVVNMAHHSYWNLGGHAGGSVLNHELTLHADEYTPGTPVVPDGRVAPVRGTAFDFTRGRTLGSQIDQVGPTPNGYDHNFVVRGAKDELRPVAELHDPVSGRTLLLSANQPGVQVYSGNFLDGLVKGKQSVAYPHRGAVCLETQGFPNAINVPAWHKQVLLNPTQPYRHLMEHRFVAR